MGLLLQSPEQLYSVIRENATNHSVEKMCQLFDVSRSNYYDWRKRTVHKSKRQLEDEILTQHICKIHEENRRKYGVPKIHMALRQEGIRCGKNRVYRLMKAANICRKAKKHYRNTTQSNHHHPIAPNLLKRNFNPNQPNKVWVTDITYIPTMTGWLYLVVVLDLFSRKVVGWSMSDRLKTDFVLSAVKMAIQNRRPAKGLIIHSDRGVQYASREYRKLLASHRIRRSMSRKGNCWDNAPAESFFSLLKKELMEDTSVFSSRSSAKLEIFDYIEAYYNRKRIHSSIKYQSPENYEKQRIVLKLSV